MKPAPKSPPQPKESEEVASEPKLAAELSLPKESEKVSSDRIPTENSSIQRESEELPSEPKLALNSSLPKESERVPNERHLASKSSFAKETDEVSSSEPSVPTPKASKKNTRTNTRKRKGCSMHKKVLKPRGFLNDAGLVYDLNFFYITDLGLAAADNDVVKMKHYLGKKKLMALIADCLCHSICLGRGCNVNFNRTVVMVKDYFKDGSDGLLESRVTPLMLIISLVGQEASAEAVDLILKQTNLGSLSFVVYYNMKLSRGRRRICVLSLK